VVATTWPASAAPAAQIPYPAVVRVIAAEHDGASMGTGALVAVDESHGLVVTNWHVVRDAAGPITVVFPDGFRSGALLLKSDRDWDLAALAIQRPPTQPLPLATAPPRPGEPLWIAGYGPEGVYRVVGGRCVKYHTPGGNLPYEIVEVDVEARRGDSGGPIYNSRGEIAGILFGAAGNIWSGGYTMGTYCGRVRMFLAAAYVDFQRLPGNTTMVAQAPAPKPQPPTRDLAALPPPPADNGAVAATGPLGQDSPERQASSTRGAAADPPLPQSGQTGPYGASLASRGKVTASRPNSPALMSPPSSSPVAQVSPATMAPQREALSSRLEQIKTVLAVIGIVAVLFHAMRILGSAAG